MRELIEMAGGIRDGHKLKFWTPGGSSTPIFTEDELDTPLDYESVGAAGSMLGTRALQVFDETVSVVRVITRWSEFYQHESCGKCTPCREGTYWMKQICCASSEARVAPAMSTCSTRSHTTLRAVASARSATPQQPRSCRASSASATSSRPASPRLPAEPFPLRGVR